MVFTVNAQIEEDFNRDITSVFNTIFPYSNKQIFFLDNYYLDYRGWGILLTDFNMLNSLYGNCICENEKKVIKLEDIITMSELNGMYRNFLINQFNSKISLIKLNKNIHFKKNKHRLNNFYKVSKPIIINDKAIVYVLNNVEEKIVFLKKVDNKWLITCTKWAFISIIDRNVNIINEKN